MVPDSQSVVLNLFASHVQVNIPEFLTLYLKELIGQFRRNKVSKDGKGYLSLLSDSC